MRRLAERAAAPARASGPPKRAPEPAAPAIPAPETATALAFSAATRRAGAAPSPPPSTRILRRKCADCPAEDEESRRTGGLQRFADPASALPVGAADDPAEREADAAAEQVMRGGPAPVLSAGPASPPLRRADEGRAGESAAPPEVGAALSQSGRPLDPGTRAFMEARFGRGFGRVRVHTGAAAEDSARSVRAHAYTVGDRLVFGAGRYRPQTGEGRRLIAHELAHTVQQGGGSPRVQRYTPEERAAMASGAVTGRAQDTALAAARGFQPGDIVFRMGSTALGLLTGEPVTHGGIYVGGGLIHDVVAFGNRHVRVADFYNPALGEAANPDTFRVVRFIGPLHDLIVARLLSNIARRDFRMPTDPVPFNLFSSADDYRTATCLEYAHAQFLYAIRQLSADTSVPQAQRDQLRATYFTGAAAEPNALIQPREQRLMGNTVDPSSISSSNGPYGMGPQRTMSALTQQALLVAAATGMASDTDPTRFSNRAESQYIQHYPFEGGGIGAWIGNALMGGMTYDEVVLRTFTYSSFVDSRRFFQDVTPPPPPSPGH